MESGEHPGVINMGVGNEDSVDVERFTGWCFPVTFPPHPIPLKDPAIDKDRVLAVLDQVFRSGYGTSCAKKFYRYTHAAKQSMARGKPTIRFSAALRSLTELSEGCFIWSSWQGSGERRAENRFRSSNKFWRRWGRRGYPGGADDRLKGFSV
jgi:hypothetical protein